MKFNHIDDLKKELENRGFQSYNLDIGLEKFEESLVSTNIRNPRTEKFEWLDEDGNAVSINITIITDAVLDKHGEIEEINYIYEV